MDKLKFEEAESFFKTIRYAERILDEYDMGNLYPNDIIAMIESNKQVTRSFRQWVKNEKEIAEQKFNQI